MSLQLLHHDRFDLPMLAGMVQDAEPFADYLAERLMDLPKQEQLADVLLLYARDMVFSLFRACEPVPYGHIFPAHFTEAALGTWLQVMVDERWKLVSVSEIWKMQGSQWISAAPDGKERNLIVFHTESAARLDLKRRVLGMFGDVEREVWTPMRMTEAAMEASWRGKVEMRQLDPPEAKMMEVKKVLHPIDFLLPRKFSDVVDLNQPYTYTAG